MEGYFNPTHFLKCSLWDDLNNGMSILVNANLKFKKKKKNLACFTHDDTHWVLREYFIIFFWHKSLVFNYSNPHHMLKVFFFKKIKILLGWNGYSHKLGSKLGVKLNLIILTHITCWKCFSLKKTKSFLGEMGTHKLGSKLGVKLNLSILTHITPLKVFFLKKRDFVGWNG